MKFESFSKGRIEAFSDGIFAIIVTLLVLEIKVPHLATGSAPEELAKQLLHLVPKFVSWLISFLTVCVIWVNHHRILAKVGQISHRLFWLNALLLLWVSFIPFPTALMGDYPSNPLAVVLYGVIMMLMASAFYAMRRQVLSEDSEAHPAMDIPMFRLATRKALLLGVLPYAFAAGLAALLPGVAMAIYFIIPLYFAWPRK